MAITDSATFANYLSNLGGNLVPWNKASLSNTVAGQQFTLWKAAGYPDVGTTPTSWVTCTQATAGAVPLTDATAPEKNYLGHISATLANVGSILLYDRVGNMAGLSGTVVTAQTVNATIPAGRALAVDGSDSEWDLEWYADTGGTAVNATVTYTDGLDAAGNTVVVALAATMRSGRMVRIPANSGHTIKSIQSVTLSATTTTAGNFGVTLRRRLGPPCSVVNVAIAESLDPWQTALAKVKIGSCIEFTMLCSTTSTGFCSGLIGVGNG